MLNNEPFRLLPDEVAQLQLQLQRTENGAENGTENKLAHEDGLSPIMLRIRVAIIDALGEELRKYRTRHTGNGTTQNINHLFEKLQADFHTEGIFAIEEVEQHTMRIRISLPASVRESPEFAALMNIIKYASLLLDRLTEARARVMQLEGEWRQLDSDIRNFKEKIASITESTTKDTSKSRIQDVLRTAEEMQSNIPRMEATKMEKEEMLRKARLRVQHFESILRQVLPHGQESVDRQNLNNLAEQLRVAIDGVKRRGHISNEHLSEDITPDFCINVPIEIEPEEIEPTAIFSPRSSSQPSEKYTRTGRKNGNRTTASATALALVALIGGFIAVASRKSDTKSQSTPTIVTSSLISNAAGSNESADDEPWMNEGQMRRVGRQMLDKLQKQTGISLLRLEGKTVEESVIIKLKIPDKIKGLTSHGEEVTVSIKREEMTVQEKGRAAIPFDNKAQGVVVQKILELDLETVVKVPYIVEVEGHGSTNDAISIKMEEVFAAL